MIFMRLHKNDILKSGAGYHEPMVYEAVLDFCKKYNKNLLSLVSIGVMGKYIKLFN